MHDSQLTPDVSAMIDLVLRLVAAGFRVKTKWYRPEMSETRMLQLSIERDKAHSMHDIYVAVTEALEKEPRINLPKERITIDC